MLVERLGAGYVRDAEGDETDPLLHGPQPNAQSLWVAAGRLDVVAVQVMAWDSAGVIDDTPPDEARESTHLIASML
ncbi:hypothetical protein GCM10028790_49140 [Micromonospora taraxaci]